MFANWIHRITESIPVGLLAGAELRQSAEREFGTFRQCDWLDIKTNDCWIRDYGPSFVEVGDEPTLQAVSWKYNAWGGKYPPWDLDDAAAEQICRQIGIAVESSGLCVEGGAMETDGRGRLLTTPQCLQTETRNPGWSRDQIASELHCQMGITEILWLDGGGLQGDDTDGHIDQLARFVSPTDVVVAVCDDTSDPNHEPLEQNYLQLKAWGASTKPAVNVHRLPIPPARSIDGQRVPESYCNFLMLGSERILVPEFGAATDDHAQKILAEITGAQIEGIDCRDLVWGLGALHCASRDQPKG